jgi:uncharacterized protein
VKEHYHRKVVKRSVDKHATPWHREIALNNTILRTEVGSGLHGTSVEGSDDRDEMGLCIEPPDCVIGYKDFEQYQWYTAWERPGGRANRSGPGDLDLTIYSLRKWMRLAMNGNPTVLLMLFAPESAIVSQTEVGIALREEMPQYILSTKAGDRFVGYLETQRECLIKGGKGKDVTRPELIAAYGYDTKFAGHMVRLGLQGAELLSTGKITLPMPEKDRELVKAIRAGERTKEWCLILAEYLEHQIEELTAASSLPPEPDYEKIDAWLGEQYTWHWTKKSVEFLCEME